MSANCPHLGCSDKAANPTPVLPDERIIITSCRPISSAVMQLLIKEIYGGLYPTDSRSQ